MGNLVYVGTFRFVDSVFKPTKPMVYIHTDPDSAAILDLAAILFLAAILDWSHRSMWLI